MLTLDPSFMLIHHTAADAAAVINDLAESLHAYGAVRADYGQETIAREVKHPTGLPTKPFAIAFPHAEAEGVFESSLAVATLNTPVSFLNMGDPEETLAVEIVFLLANKEPEEQVQALRQLALIFSDSEKLVHLKEMESAEIAVEWFRNQLRSVE